MTLRLPIYAGRRPKTNQRCLGSAPACQPMGRPPRGGVGNRRHDDARRLQSKVASRL